MGKGLRPRREEANEVFFSPMEALGLESLFTVSRGGWITLWNEKEKV